MLRKRLTRLKKRRNQRRKTWRRRRIQRGGNPPPLVGLLDNADAVPIVTQQPIELHVKFGPASVKSAAEFGHNLTIEETQPEPHAYWTPPPANVLYTFVCWDPDAPAKSWLHWLITNCKGRDPTTGDIITDWSPPTPPKGSGLHRYIFGLFQQATHLTIEPMPSSGGFHVATFATQHQLSPLAYKGVRIIA